MKYLYIFLVSFFFIVACSEEKVENTVNVLTSSQISISPQEIEISYADTATFTLKLSNPGNYNWHIANRPPWLMVSQENGTFTGDSMQFQAMVDFSRTQNSIFSNDSFSIVTNGAGSCQSLVFLSAEEYVRPKIQSDEIYFPSGVSSQLVTFYNPSYIYRVTLSLRTDEDWIITEGSKYYIIPEGGEQRYKLKIDKSKLPEGEAHGKVTVIFGGLTWKDSLFLPVRVDIP